jgi:hypothetical protein
LGQVLKSEIMAGLSSSRMLLVLLVVLLPCLAVQAKGPKHLQLFAHEDRIPPNNTLIVSASPTLNFSGADQFGLIRTVDNVLRESADNTSKILGSQTGIIVVGKDAANVFITFTYHLNEHASHQGTIAVHGYIDGTSTNLRIFGVVGGTGDFIGASGDDRSLFDSPTLTTNIVNIHNLTLHYPSWH